MINAIILIFCLALAWLSFKNLKWPLYLIIAFLPSYLIRFTLFKIPVTLLEAMIIIAFVFFLTKYKLTWLKDFKNNAFFWPIMAILMVASFSTIISPDFIKAAGLWKAYFIEPILFYIILINSIKTKNDWQNIFWALGLSALYLGLIAGWQFESGWNVPAAFLKNNTSVDRVVSVFGYPNALGLYLGPIIILFSGWLLQPAKKILQLSKLAVIILSFATIVLAKSEAAILSIIAVWLMAGLIIKKTRYYFLALTVLAILIFMVIPQINGYLSEKILLQDYSGFIRRLIWQESFAMLKDNWFLGAGLAGYQIKIAPYHLPTFEIFLYPHNIVLNFWSELGLTGLLVFIWLIILFLWKNLVEILRATSLQEKILYLTLIFVMLQLLIHGLVDAPYFKNDLSVLFWLIIGLYTINENIK